MNTVRQNSKRRILRKSSENRFFFPANLILHRGYWDSLLKTALSALTIALQGDECNKCDSKGNLWAFGVGSSTVLICAHYHHVPCAQIPTAHPTDISRFLCFFSLKLFPEVAFHSFCQHYFCGNLAGSRCPPCNRRQGGVGHFPDERRFSVDSSLQAILYDSFLWKRTNSSVVIHTWSWHGKHAASARACLREANTEC